MEQEIKHRELHDRSGDVLAFGDLADGQSSNPVTEEEEDEVLLLDPLSEIETAALGDAPQAADQSVPSEADKSKSESKFLPAYLKSWLKGLKPCWLNWTLRLFTTVMLISSFSVLIYLGPLAVVLLVVVLQLAVFHETISVGYQVYRSHDLPWFRLLSWYFLFTTNYFLFGESLIARFRLLLAKEDLLQPLITHHHFLSFTFYSAGIVWFVLSLVKKHYMKQFTLFGWTHVTLLLCIWSSHFQMQNIFNGLIWFLLPVSLVICNDIMAYVFGFFFGRTPLIKLSPKKTWEGFIGGGLSTIVFGIAFSAVLVRYNYFVCPLEWDEAREQLTTECVRNPVFLPRTYNLSGLLFFLPIRQFDWYPFYWHSLLISVYIAVVGPFGGFFASGFKRAFRIKDFGDVLPGHGGIVDRMDCQFIVGVFVFIYYNTFVRVSDVASLLPRIHVLPVAEQLTFYRLLTESLHQRGLLTDSLAQLVAETLTVESTATPGRFKQP